MLAQQQLWMISYFSTNPYGVYNLDIRIIKPAAFGSKLKQCEKKQTNNNTLADSDKLFWGDYQNNSSSISIIILALLLLLKMPTDQTHTWIINLESSTATVPCQLLSEKRQISQLLTVFSRESCHFTITFFSETK